MRQRHAEVWKPVHVTSTSVPFRAGVLRTQNVFVVYGMVPAALLTVMVDGAVVVDVQAQLAPRCLTGRGLVAVGRRDIR